VVVQFEMEQQFFTAENRTGGVYEENLCEKLYKLMFSAVK